MEKLIKDLINPTKNFDDDVQKLRSFSAKTDISESEIAFFLELSVPGFEKQDISISVEQNILNIKGTRNLKEGQEAFDNKFSLPKNIAVDQILAKAENGILSLELPKSKEQKLKIEIQSH